MTVKRIIPRLDIKGRDLVKGIQLEGLRVLGNPMDAALYYYEKGADEIMLVDVVASLYDRNNLSDLIKEITQEVFIPITVGGGIRSLNNISSALNSGADKVSINTEGLKNINFLKEAIKTFGSSTIVCSVEASFNLMNEFYCFTDNGREFSSVKVSDWIEQLVDVGVGEIFVTSIDYEGTNKGFDEKLLNLIPNDIKIPVIYHGGFNSLNHIVNIFKNYKNIDGVALASILHYSSLKELNKSNKILEGNNDFITENENSIKENISISSIKDALLNNNVLTNKRK